MNQINFLPSSFVAQQEQRSRTVRQCLLTALLVAGMAGGHLALRQRGIFLTQQAQYLEQEAQSLQTQMMESARLVGLREDLLRRVRLQQELLPPIAPSQLLALVGQALPPAANLLTVTINDTTPALPEKKATRTKKEAATKTEETAPPPVYTMQLMLVGMAPSDAEVADFFGNLAALPVFENAKLHYSRPTRIGGLSAREFRIELEAPLDRRIVPTGTAGQGVAHAH